MKKEQIASGREEEVNWLLIHKVKTTESWMKPREVSIEFLLNPPLEGDGTIAEELTIMKRAAIANGTWLEKGRDRDNK